MRNLTTAQRLQWICFSVLFIGLVVAFIVAPYASLLTILLISAAFLMAIVWIVFIVFYGRKLFWSYKFPLGLLGATIIALLFSPIDIYVLPRPLVAERQISQLGTALDSFKHDVGRYPSIEEGLQALRVKTEGAEGWDGPYLQKEIPNDPWNHPYIYRFPGKNPGQPDIISYGADGKPGGTGENADIVSE